MKTVMMILMVAVTLIFSSCSNSTDGDQKPRVSFTIRTTQSGLARPAADSLVLSLVELQFKEIEFESETADSVEYETKPLSVQVPLNGNPVELTVNEIPAGMYDKIEMEFGGEDSDHDGIDSSRHSVRVEGTFNGEPFVFFSYVCYEIENVLNPPLVIDENAGSYNITLSFDPYSWFRDIAGNVINPTDPKFRSVIDHNIKQSFHSYEDNDRDGHDDHSDGY